MKYAACEKNKIVLMNWKWNPNMNWKWSPNTNRFIVHLTEWTMKAFSSWDIIWVDVRDVSLDLNWKRIYCPCPFHTLKTALYYYPVQDRQSHCQIMCHIADCMWNKSALYIGSMVTRSEHHSDAQKGISHKKRAFNLII